MEEYVDILDGNGNPTGQTKLKSEVHRDGDWHKSVHIWVINSKNELLIQKRASIKESWPNLFDISAAGHVSAGEKPITSAIREVREELGLDVSEKDFEYLFTVPQQITTNNGAFINNEFSDVYLVKTDLDLSKFELQKEEVAEVKFIPFKDLQSAIINKSSEFVPHPEEYRLLFEKLEGLFQS